VIRLEGVWQGQGRGGSIGCSVARVEGVEFYRKSQAETRALGITLASGLHIEQ